MAYYWPFESILYDKENKEISCVARQGSNKKKKLKRF